jgi:hypothetical protein
MCFSLPSITALYQTAFQSYRSSESVSVYLYEASQIYKDVELGNGSGGNSVGTNSDDGGGLGLITSNEAENCDTIFLKSSLNCV